MSFCGWQTCLNGLGWLTLWLEPSPRVSGACPVRRKSAAGAWADRGEVCDRPHNLPPLPRMRLGRLPPCRSPSLHRAVPVSTVRCHGRLQAPKCTGWRPSNFRMATSRRPTPTHESATRCGSTSRCVPVADPGIDTPLLKGAALATGTYRDGHRPINGLDLPVQRDQADAAITSLVAAGWTPRFAAGRAEAVAKGFDLGILKVAQGRGDDFPAHAPALSRRRREHVADYPQGLHPALQRPAERVVIDLNADRAVVTHPHHFAHKAGPVVVDRLRPVAAHEAVDAREAKQPRRVDNPLDVLHGRLGHRRIGVEHV